MSAMGPALRPRSNHSRDGTPSWLVRGWPAPLPCLTASSARPATLLSTVLRPSALPEAIRPEALPGDRGLDGVRSPPLGALGAAGAGDLGGVLVRLRAPGAAALDALGVGLRAYLPLRVRLRVLLAALRDGLCLRGVSGRRGACAWDGDSTVRLESVLGEARLLSSPRLLL